MKLIPCLPMLEKQSLVGLIASERKLSFKYIFALLNKSPSLPNRRQRKFKKYVKNAEKDRLFSVEKTCILKGKNREYFCQLERRNAECILYRKKGPILIWILPAIPLYGIAHYPRIKRLLDGRFMLIFQADQLGGTIYARFFR